MEEKNFNKEKGKIMRILRNAFKAKYYQQCFSELNLDLSRDITYEEFKKIPVMDKNNYNANKFDLVTLNTDDFDRDYYFSLSKGNEKQEYLQRFKLRYMTTSGSTGQPLEVLKGYNDEYMDYFTLNYYRKKMSNYNFKGAFVWIWPENPIMRQFLNGDMNGTELKKYRIENRYGYKYFMHEHSDKNFKDLYDFICEKKCEWVTSSPSLLYKLACYIQEKQFNYIEFQYIECHSEKLYDWQKEKIEEVFKCKPVSIYSSNEIQFMAGMCENEHLHMFSKGCFIEFMENNGIKEVCVTSLNYFDVPIIRYKLGDCGDWCYDEQCDSRLGKLPSFVLNGTRVNDLLTTKSGTIMEPFVITDSVHLLCNRFGLEIKQHKIKQLSPDSFAFYFSKRDLDSSNIEYRFFLQDYLTKLLGYEVNVTIAEIEDLKELNDGRKFRYFERCF